MSNKEDKGLYRSHSRKELQSLCKRYGLPANRSRSDLAKSLTSYLENQRLGSMTSRGRLYEIQEVRLPLSLKLPFRDFDKDFYGLISCPADSCNGGIYPQAVKCNSLGGCAGDKFYHKDGYGIGSTFFQQAPQPQFVTQYNVSGFKNEEFPTIYFDRNCLSLTRDERMNDMPQIEYKDSNVGASSNEAAFCSSMNTPTVSGSSFQFNVSSEEGINLYVDLNSNPSEWVEKVKSEVSICQNMSHRPHNFHKELGRFWESSKPLDHLDRDDGPFHSTVMTPCAEAVDGSQHLGYQGTPSFKDFPDFQEEIISSGVSSAKDRCLITLDSNIRSPREILDSDGMLNISDDSLNLLTLKHQNSNLENEIRDTSTPQSGSLQTPMPEDVVHQKKKLHSPCENGQFVNLVDPKHNMHAEQDGLGSTGHDQETIRNQFPILVEEQGRSKIINWKESSECSHDDCGVLDNVNAKVLRSAKHLTRTVLPRRSIRLVSK